MNISIGSLIQDKTPAFKGKSGKDKNSASVLFLTEEDAQAETAAAEGKKAGGKASSSLPAGFKAALKPLFQEKLFKGRAKQSFFLPPPLQEQQAPEQQAGSLLLVGLGPEKEFSSETVRRGAALAVKELTVHGRESAAVFADSLLKGKTPDTEALARAAAEGAVLASWKERKFKNPDPKEKKEETEVKNLQFLFPPRQAKAASAGLETGRILGEAANHAKTLATAPGNFMTPSFLAKEALRLTKGTQVKTTVWDKARITKEKMGGLLGVSQGSAEEPRFIIMEYKGGPGGDKGGDKGGGKAGAKPIVLAGKGVTFDSGGVSIKPGKNMDEMKFDMSGSAAVIGAVTAIAKLKLKVNVTGLVAATENMPDGAALKPGDVIKARNGKTMEILNTDAEGRLILADALSYASEQKPQAIFDAATLTGAVVGALGNLFTGFFTKNEELAKRIQKAGEASGERMWRLPLVKEHAEDMKSPIADIANISGGWGAGSATAAAFLEFFTDKKIPWAHFDIAGTAYNVERRLDYCSPKSASGVMVRTFVELARSFE